MFSLITNFLEPLSYFIYLAAFLLYCKNEGNGKTKIALFFYLFAGILLSFASVLAQMGKGNVFIYDYLLLPFSILFFSLYFKQILKAKKQRIALVLFTVNVLSFIFRAIMNNHQVYFDSTGFALLNITVVICCFLFFSQKLNEISESSLFRDFNFWVVCSFLISFSGSFVVLLTYYYLSKKIVLSYIAPNRHLLTLLWGIPNVLLFVGSLFTLTGIIWIQYHKKLSL